MLQYQSVSYSLYTWQFLLMFLGWLSDPFGRLSDLQLGDKKVTLNHLVYRMFSIVSVQFRISRGQKIYEVISLKFKGYFG